MRLTLSKLIFVPVVAVCVGAFAVVGAILFESFIEKQNRRQFEDLNRRMLARAERAVDYAFVSLVELVQAGAVSCSEESLARMRQQVYRHSSLKDIRLASHVGRVLCSAYPETLQFDANSLAEAAPLPSRNQKILLFRLDQPPASALGLLWQLNEQISLVAVVNVEGLLFDVLPAAIRENARASLELGDAGVIAAYEPQGGLPHSRAEPVNLSVASSRYPFQTSIHVSAETFGSWNKEAEPWVIFAAGLLGMAFGVLLSKSLQRPTDPVAELDRALAAGQFVPFLQPVFRLTDRKIVGCEALARWRRGDGSIALPYGFIPLAEQSGRIAPMTRQIISKALNHLAPLMRADKTFTVAFNIAPEHFLSEGFVGEMRELAREAKVGTRQIAVEITERQQLQNLAAAAEVIEKLRDHGFQVAIDDTGTGHSGLTYIHKLGANAIKIDKLFIDSIGKDYTAQAVVVMLVKLARELHMTTVAEGIETEEQMALLREWGVDEGQGYIVAPPLPPDAFTDLVMARQGGLRRSLKPPAARVA